VALIPDASLFVMRPRYYGETNRDFQGTYSDHLPLLMEIALPEQLPATSWQALVSLAVIMALSAIYAARCVRKKRRS
jgi:hypothetical protein